VIAIACLVLAYVVGEWWFVTDMIVLALIFGGFAARIWITKRNARIILNADSFHYTYWREPILFKNLTHLSITNHNGVRLMFHFKEAREPLVRYSLPFKRKTVGFLLRDVVQKQELVDKTFCYFQRQID